MIFIGGKIGLTIRIGTLLGEGKPILAKRLTGKCMKSGIYLAAIFLVIMYLIRDQIIVIFVSDEITI